MIAGLDCCLVGFGLRNHESDEDDRDGRSDCIAEKQPTGCGVEEEACNHRSEGKPYVVTQVIEGKAHLAVLRCGDIGHKGTSRRICRSIEQQIEDNEEWDPDRCAEKTTDNKHGACQ